MLSWTTGLTHFADKSKEDKLHPAPIVMTATPEKQSANILSTHHVEKLGGELFSKYLIGVETAAFPSIDHSMPAN